MSCSASSFRSASRAFALALASSDFLLLAFEPGQELLRSGVELCALHVVARLHQIRLPLLFLNLILRLRLADFFFGLLQLGELLCVRALHRHGIETDHHVALLDVGAVLRELENLEVPG